MNFRDQRRLNDTHEGSSRIDGRTTRPPGYAESQRRRKRIEEVFGRHRGRRKVGWVFTFTAAAYNLVPLRNLAVAI